MKLINDFFVFLFVGVVRLYKLCISPYLGKACRFTPTCSEYMIESVQKRGLLIGIFKGFYRVLRCNPFNNNSGYDPV